MKLILSTHLFVIDQIDQSVIRVIREYFENIEIWGMIPHFNYLDREWIHNIHRYIREEDINVISFHAPIYKDISDAKAGKWLSLSDPDEYKRIDTLNRTKSLIDIMNMFGASIIVIHPGGEGSPVENLYRSINELISYCKGKGIKIALENGITDFSKTENIIDIVERFHEEYVGICLDLGHTNIIEDPIQALYRCKERLLSIHVSDNNGKEDSHMLPFEGNIPWIDISKTLKDINYEGPFVYELRKYENDYKGILLKAKKTYREIWR
jgi:sugar phosphate isomerase/epimerase